MWGEFKAFLLKSNALALVLAVGVGGLALFAGKLQRYFADGARSTVRRLLGIELKGRTHEERWLIVDVAGTPARRNATSQSGSGYNSPTGLRRPADEHSMATPASAMAAMTSSRRAASGGGMRVPAAHAVLANSALAASAIT